MEFTRDLLLDDERRMLLESVSSFRAQVLDEFAREMDERPSSGRVEEVWKQAGPLGITEALLSGDKGGQGMDIYSFCLVLEEVARSSAGLSALLLSHNLALRALDHSGVSDLDGVPLAGEGWAALSFPLKTAEHGYRVDFVPGGSGASLFVFALPGGDDLYRVYPGDGISVEEIIDPLGLRAAKPAALLVGEVGDEMVCGKLGEAGVGQLEAILLLGIGSISLGLARQAYDKAYAYARERYQACDYIINHEQIRLMLSDMLLGIEASGVAVRQAAVGDGSVSPRLSACRAAKVLACGRTVSATTDGVQIHGGYGYMREYGMERLMRDAKYCQSFPRSPQEEMLALLD